MEKIQIDIPPIPSDIILTLRDLRNSDHPEFKDYEDIKIHISNAIRQNGLRYYGKSIFQEIYKLEIGNNPISLFQHLYHLAGGAKGIIKYRIRHKKSTYARYKSFRYETFDLLLRPILLKHRRKIYKGYNGYQRIELIESVNRLCADIKNPTVLEAGCGAGLNIYLLNALNENLEIHGFEYTNSRIASCLVNLFYSNIVHNIFLADVCSLNIPENSYDVVFSNHVLEQLGQAGAETALSEMWRVCKKGVVLSEPSVHGANVYEKWRMNTLGYCKDLYPIAEKLPGSRILIYAEDKFRPYPNTSHHLVIEKVKSETDKDQ